MPSQLHSLNLYTAAQVYHRAVLNGAKLFILRGGGQGSAKDLLHLLSVLFHRLNVQSMKPSFWETVRLSHMILVGMGYSHLNRQRRQTLDKCGQIALSKACVYEQGLLCTADQIRRRSKIIVNTEQSRAKILHLKHVFSVLSEQPFHCRIIFKAGRPDIPL